MALKIRQKKQRASEQSSSRHVSYSGRAGQHWMDQYREENNQSVRKSFVMVVIVMVIIIVLLILSAITTFTVLSDDTSQITAADTFAVTSYEQEQMSEDARRFAEGILVYAYCSDAETSEQGKVAALQKMAQNTTSYERIQALETVSPVIAPENFVPVTTDPVLQNPTMAYAGSFTYEFDGVAADSSVVDENNPNGTFADNGYHFTVTFNNTQDAQTGEQVWVITNVSVQAK